MALPLKQMFVTFCLWALALLVASAGCVFLGSYHAYGPHSDTQLMVGIVSCVVLAACAACEISLTWSNLFIVDAKTSSAAPGDIELQPPAVVVGAASASDSDKLGKTDNASGEVEPATTETDNLVKEAAAVVPTEKEVLVALLTHLREPLRAGTEFIFILALMYFCDRTNIVPTSKKIYNPTHFWILWGLICIAALITMKTLKDSKPMQREQTDEWKGWMQLMFLLYHYFEEKEVYNAIRVYIAAYVWMTGYGNWSLYIRGKSFTIRRTLQMLFRLNFLVVFVCMVLRDEYMLYYIAPMHTLFTVFVILVLYVGQSLNGSKKGLYAKILITFVLTTFLYDGPPIVFKAVFGTVPVVKPLLAFHDPVHPEFKDELHEWHFRSGLDRFIWIVGMIAALHFDDFASLLDRIEAPEVSAYVSRAGLLAFLVAALGGWYYFAFSLHKYAYNVRHPYTSFIPITAYIFLRNFTPALRQRYLFLFAYLGRVTLETYILQFHVWMKTTGINGSPKFLLMVIPSGVPFAYWLNFAVLSAVYLFVSVRLTGLTITLRDALIPPELKSICKIWTGIAAMVTLCWLAVFFVRA